MIRSYDSFHNVFDKLTSKVIEYEWVLSDLRRNLQDKNIRRVYRLLSVPMPEDLEAHLAKSGAVLWEEFTKTSVNKFDIKAVMSQ